ncbi:interleukin-10 receptor subunit beta isoform X5 [Haliaeetus albicilla]
MVSAALNKRSIPSAWKCVTADSVAQQDYHTVGIAGAICFSLMVAGALKCMHAGGYILQKKSLPRTLVFIRTLAYSPWTSESEEIASVEIIYKEVKKKTNEHIGGISDEDDSDDSDSDAISNHDYTRRGIISRVPHSSDTINVFVQYSANSTCDNSSSQASENPDADPEDFEEHEMDIEEDNTSISGIVPKPQNARIISVNLRSTLQWDAPRFHKGNISYTVQSKSINFPGDTYENVSTNLRLTECDVSSLSAYGDYVLQVRAESENNHSDWATVRFKPMDDTVIGPPDVKVKSESGSLHVDFIGPFAEHEHDRWPLKQYYGSWNYRILYWKKGSNTEVTHIDTKHNSEILSQLEPWTIYCIQVQAVIPEWNKTGELSRDLCEQTTHNGVTPVWIIVTVLIGSMLVVVISVPVCFFSFLYLYRLTKHVFCPSYIFPQHLKEFLSKPPSGAQFFSPLPQEEHLFYDKLTVISEESKNNSDETGDEASKTTEHLQDSEQEDSGSRIVPASEKA